MFYFVCALVGLFCIVALGLGPAFFVLLGLGVGIVGFRARLRTWWGLPLSAAGLFLVLVVALGWRTVNAAEAVVVVFAVVALARMVGRLESSRR